MKIKIDQQQNKERQIEINSFSGLQRIEEIKNEFKLTSPSNVCRAEVYEMWEDD